MWKVVLVVIAGLFVMAALQDFDTSTADSAGVEPTQSPREKGSRSESENLPESYVSLRDEINEITDAARRCVAALNNGNGGAACDSFDEVYASAAKDVAASYERRKDEWGDAVSPREARAIPASLGSMQRRIDEIDTLRNPWSIRQGTSQIDDSPSVSLHTRSNERVRDRFGRNAAPATLTLSCLENTTRLLINMNNNHMASSPYHDWGHVTMRIDSRQAFTRQMQESTDNSVLGLWRGGQSIPVIRDMFGAEKLTVRATPFGQSPITVTFDISGLQEEIQPLRQACNW